MVSRPDGVGSGYGFKDEDEAPRSAAAPRASGTAAKASFAAAFDEDDEVDDEAVVAPVAAPTAAPAEEAALPKRTIVKKVVAKK